MMEGRDPLSLFDRLEAVKPDGLSFNAWTNRAGVSRAAFTDIKKRGNAQHDTIAKLLAAIGVTFAEFESGMKATEKEPSAEIVRAPRLAFQADERPRDIPILGTAECGEIDFDADSGAAQIEAMALYESEVIDHARRPATLDHRREIYAIYFRGNSMEPRYEDGELAYVDPKRPARAREYVVLQLRAADGADGERVVKVLAKRLVRQSATFVELQQFNPPATFRVDKKSVMHMHRIIPWDELVTF